MKKLLFAIFMSLSFAGTYAQENKLAEEVPQEKPVNNNYFGIKAGANYSNFSIKGFTDGDNLIGPNVGLFFESRQNERFSFLMEINYSKKGGTIKDSIAEYKTSLEYLDIPLMINFYPIRGLSIGLGVQPSIYVGGRVKAHNLTNNSETSMKIPEGPGFHYPVYLGFVAGINYKITEALNVDLKYSPSAHFYQNSRVDAITLRVGYALIKNTN